MDHRPATDQAGQPHAADASRAAAASIARRLSGEPQMTALNDTSERLATIERSWRRRPGFLGWLSEDTHKSIGMRFILTSLVFFALAGLEAFVMRLQLARPD